MHTATTSQYSVSDDAHQKRLSICAVKLFERGVEKEGPDFFFNRVIFILDATSSFCEVRVLVLICEDAKI